MYPTAWLEPSTVSIGLYFSCSLLKGQSGIRLLKRRLKKAREWGRDALTDELSDFLCDHPELLVLALLTSTTLKLVYSPKPTFKDNFLLSIVGSPEFHGLPLSCSHLFGVPRCTQFTQARMFVRLRSSFRSNNGLCLQCCSGFTKGRHFGQKCEGRSPPLPLSCLSHVRILPFLRDGDPIKRHEEAVQDTC
jgi:hypothetical protein